jgi:hypothetical protein
LDSPGSLFIAIARTYGFAGVAAEVGNSGSHDRFNIRGGSPRRLCARAEQAAEKAWIHTKRPKNIPQGLKLTLI